MYVMLLSRHNSRIHGMGWGSRNSLHQARRIMYPLILLRRVVGQGMSKSAALKLADVRHVFRILGDVRDIRTDPQAMRRRIADGLCELVRGCHAFTLDLAGMTPLCQVQVRQMVIGGHPDEQGLEYLFE